MNTSIHVSKCRVFQSVFLKIEQFCHSFAQSFWWNVIGISQHSSENAKLYLSLHNLSESLRTISKKFRKLLIAEIRHFEEWIIHSPPQPEDRSFRLRAGAAVPNRARGRREASLREDVAGPEGHAVHGDLRAPLVDVHFTVHDEVVPMLGLTQSI